VQSVRYLPSSNTEKGFSTAVVATTTTTVSVEELSPPKGRRAKGTLRARAQASPAHSNSRHYWLCGRTGRKAKLHQDDEEEEQSLQAKAFSRKDKQKNKKVGAQGKNAKKKEQRRRR
jgi:hypothetical protein